MKLTRHIACPAWFVPRAKELGLSSAEAVVVAALLEAPMVAASTLRDRLLEAGAESANIRNTLSVVVCRLNLKLAPLGFKVDSAREGNRVIAHSLPEQARAEWSAPIAEEPGAPPTEWRCSQAQAIVARLLIANPRVSRDQLIEALEAVFPSNARKGCDVHVFRLREKLKPFGLRIDTIAGVGWAFDDASRAKLQPAKELAR